MNNKRLFLEKTDFTMLLNSVNPKGTRNSSPPTPNVDIEFKLDDVIIITILISKRLAINEPVDLMKFLNFLLGMIQQERKQ
ncbi:MAG: hypothetical protein LBD17_01370 [Endomicrobium sp.]|jgi:hypothetical protein|nr:hypothetical protein [Endomicrobium sp.]